MSKNTGTRLVPVHVQCQREDLLRGAVAPALAYSRMLHGATPQDSSYAQRDRATGLKYLALTRYPHLNASPVLTTHPFRTPIDGCKIRLHTPMDFEQFGLLNQDAQFFGFAFVTSAAYCQRTRFARACSVLRLPLLPQGLLLTVQQNKACDDFRNLLFQ